MFTDEASFVIQKPGIRFTEKMVGTYEPSNNNAKQTPCEFTLTIDSDDVERMLNSDPSHSATISGTVTCLALSSAPLSVSEGKFEHKCFYKERIASVCSHGIVWGRDYYIRPWL